MGDELVKRIINGKKYEIEIVFLSSDISLFDLIFNKIEKENIEEEKYIDD